MKKLFWGRGFEGFRNDISLKGNQTKGNVVYDSKIVFENSQYTSYFLGFQYREILAYSCCGGL